MQQRHVLGALSLNTRGRQRLGGAVAKAANAAAAAGRAELALCKENVNERTGALAGAARKQHPKAAPRQGKEEESGREVAVVTTDGQGAAARAIAAAPAVAARPSEAEAAGVLRYSRELLLSLREACRAPPPGLDLRQLDALCKDSQRSICVIKRCGQTATKVVVRLLPAPATAATTAVSLRHAAIPPADAFAPVAAPPALPAPAPAILAALEPSPLSRMLLAVGSPEFAPRCEMLPDKKAAAAPPGEVSVYVPSVEDLKRKALKKSGCLEENESRLAARQKQIDYGVVTDGYRNYITFEMLRGPGKCGPVFPNKFQKCSKRSWDGQVKKWRRDLHWFDPVTTEEEWAAALATIASLAEDRRYVQQLLSLGCDCPYADNDGGTDSGAEAALQAQR
eukprot:TRINITY_DN17968_c0_g1_i1.p1 TRINITY_DN17968_c0_g1~~TRINITY_DN17968_c0_g1_i1.p1  ORF type:complete len:395 (+),score=111.26 TRINITY_DN17968_c0_g1_i1:184-1368(+)